MEIKKNHKILGMPSYRIEFMNELGKRKVAVIKGDSFEQMKNALQQWND